MSLKEARSRIVAENVQELLDAESDSAKWSTLQNAQQYQTPERLLPELTVHLPIKSPRSVIDPQCATGNLLNYRMVSWPYKFGIEIDNRIGGVSGVQLITSDCQKVFDVLDDIAPGLVWETFNANPPFGKRWSVDGKIVDSTEYTWGRAIKHGCQGIFISNHKTMERLGYSTHPFVVKYLRFADVWPQCEVEIGVAIWHNPEAVATHESEIYAQWFSARTIIEEEKANRPKFNIFMGGDGKLRTYLSTRSTVKYKLKREEVLKLHTIANSHPLALTTERETRKLLRTLVDCGFYQVEPAALTAIEDALAQVKSQACPIMPVTDFEKVAYADEEDHLVCLDPQGMDFTAGNKYELRTAAYSFTQTFKRDKVHYNEETEETFTEKHECTLTGQDRYIEILDDQKIARRFMDKPREKVANEHDESLLWKIFQQPLVPTIAEVNPDGMAMNKKLMRTCEMLAGYKYYEGQTEYLSRVLVKDYALIAAAVGTGKTLMAITLISTKAPNRALIVAPQGTMRSSGDEDDEEEYQASQWITELRRFAPYLQIFELFSMEDYKRIKSMNGGELPPGVYVSYYTAFFQNKARESCPDSWDDAKLQKTYPDLHMPPFEEGSSYYCHSIGKEENGIRCVLAPSMSTLIGDQFDMVLLDEAHTACNPEANVSQQIIRLQPKYRYGLTATPMPNVVTNLFNLMGWLCVPDWYKGDRRNSAWPYAREEYGRFEGTFMAQERDLTQERFNKAKNPDWNGKCVKPSPVISSPARLLKIIRPTLAFISKEKVNPKYVPAKVVDVRVPMGMQQNKLYGHFLNRGNIPCRHPLIRARKQIAYLRGICADPAGFEHGGPKVASNFNPKTIAILELVASMRQRGEQVVIVCSRKGQTSALAHRLTEAGIKFSRIDSTVPPSEHSAQSNLFKAGKTPVILMGIKCAVGYSFPDCPNLIIGSLEYSFGSFEQAKGRVDRVNSKKPATIYCVLNKDSLEETMFDVVATKGDSATICLRGHRVPRDYKPLDIGEVLANSMLKFKDSDSSSDEMSLEQKWPALRMALAK